ncbi:hypothetical protein NDU88_004168 [Pleurodeles waltl]|uniref:Uncharacterized protein n=1 Tax=Pleurodeles waltl TaxID=8319 RepID=A0AAV7TQR4_PLEWA|nr:hypothetical protein NDU88_004168 [Pleurodeles waltl]
MQVRVPWTQAWLCTKDFHRKCTGAGVAAKSWFPAMQPSEVRQGLTSTKLGLKSHWTVGVTWTESLDSRDLACRAERRPKGLYLVDYDLTSPQELGKKADKWVRTRVNRKVHTGGDKDGNKKKDGGTRRSQIGPEERGDVEQDKEPSLKQVAPGEVPETGTTRICETVLAEVAQRSPTSLETNLESRAMQVRVLWTQAWLCTKDFRRKCTGAGVAAKSRFPAMQPSEVRQGLTSTKLGLKSHWTVGVTWTASLDSRDLARRSERRPKGPVMQLFCACGCRGKIPSTHGRFLRSFWCREEADYPHSMHKQENSREGGRISVTELQ